jgi:hypothetical protein
MNSDNDLPLSVEIGEGFGRDFDLEEEFNPRRSLRRSSGMNIFGFYMSKVSVLILAQYCNFYIFIFICHSNFLEQIAH